MNKATANSFNKSVHILIIDDDIEQLAEMVDWLDHREGQIYQARSSEQAQKILASQWIDAVITDWQLPEMSGLDLIRHLRDAHFQGPILLCTGMMLSPRHLQEAFDAGANDYLRKPLNRVELNARFDSALQLYYQQEALHKLNQSQEQFIHLLSQTLGNKLQHLDHMQRLAPNPDAEQALTQEMSKTFQKMMGWARYRFQLQHVYRQSFELKTLIDDLASHFPEHWHRVNLRKIKGISLSTDPNLLQRILYELLDNALRYTHHNVTLKAQEKDQGLTLSVYDQGESLSEGDLERLRDPQQQGLGLSICSDLLALLDSQLQTRRSRRGENVFFFYLKHR